jgi:hypothetical protein
VLEPNVNRSLEFVETIGRMYFMKRNHKQLVQQKMKLLLNFINERYQINTSSIDKEFFHKLHLKSDIKTDAIRLIFSNYSYLESAHHVNDDDLIYFHNLLVGFYKNCK